jgi:hypothetical protein
LFITLTIGWAIFCTVLYPLKCQFDEQDKAEVQHYKDIMECGQHLGAFPCFERVDQDDRAMMEDMHSTSSGCGISLCGCWSSPLSSYHL